MRIPRPLKSKYLGTFPSGIVLTAFLICLHFSEPISGNVLSDFAGVIFKQDTANTRCADPRLIAESPVTIPAILFKKAISGTVIARVNIDDKGIVQKCTIVRSLHPEIDSLVQYSILHSTYSAAIDSGRAVPATIQLEMIFDPDSLIVLAQESTPDLKGSVIDYATQSPIVGAQVKIAFADSSSDTAISIGFGRYLQLIGKISGQKAAQNVLLASTDSLGHFAFRHLPHSKMRVEIRIPEYSVLSSDVLCDASTQTVLSCRLVRIPQRILTGDTLVVYSPTDNLEQRIDINKAQRSRGMVHSLSDILRSQTTIRSTPKSSSMLLVRCGSPFDNRYIVAGVPFLIPYHFGGYPNGETDGLIVSTLKDVVVNVNRIAGQYPDATGAVIEANPGIYRPALRGLKKRPELFIDYGRLSAEFLLSFPIQEKRDGYVQVGASAVDKYLFECLQNWNGYGAPAVGIGNPDNYGNFTLTAAVATDSLAFESFGWLAYDIYKIPSWPVGDKSFAIPWGMFSVGMHPVNRQNPHISVGGSRQYYTAGKRVGNDRFLNKAELNNATIEFTFDTLSTAIFKTVVDGRVLFTDWNGTLVNQGYLPEQPVLSVRNSEVQNTLHAYSVFSRDRFLIGTDLLAFGTFYNGVFDFAFDPGITLRYGGEQLQTELHAGLVTTTPDLRGLPSPEFRRRHLRTLLLSAPIFYQQERIKWGIQPYWRLQDCAPQLDPVKGIWDTTQVSGLDARGIDFDCEAKLFSFASLHGVLNLADAHRKIDDQQLLYEWNVPFTGRLGLHLTLAGDMVHLYLEQTYQKGLPYYDLANSKYESLADYMPFNVSFQCRNNNIQHRYLTQYDGYVTVNDVFGNSYTQGYYWDYSMKKVAVNAAGTTVNMGLKVGFRF